ncbi:MAG: gliding motility protein GldM [Filimonas sp.]|nr:gliding motility protein GldM [Filimonas sp.]
MSLPKEPRQKMINMMYLVLTALLALNVSSEILNAFKTVDRSLTTANGIIDEKNKTILASLEAKEKDAQTHDRAAIWLPKAQQAQKLSEDMYTYIDGLKLALKQQAGLKTENGVEEYKEDNLDAATKLFLEKPAEKGKELYNKLDQYKKALLAIDPAIGQEFAKSLPVDLSVPPSKEGIKKEWDETYFHMTPAIAGITILSKFQNDIRNSEALVVDFCHRKVGEVQLVYDAFQAFAGTNSTYLMPGQELQITAGVGSFSTKALPTVTVDGAVIPLGTDGSALYKTNVGGPGTYTKKVVVSFKKPDGTVGTETKDITYTVGSPTGISVSADAVKVLYIGLDNPISISGGNGGAEKVNASISQGSLKNEGNGRYTASVSTPGKATISVTSDGKTQAFEFKVKTVPPPTVKVGGSAGGRMSVNTFKAQVGVRADLENFVFEGVKYEVTGFTLFATGKGFENGPKYTENNGAYFSAEAKAIIESTKVGSTVMLDRVRVSGPGGSQTLPTPIAFNLTN